MVGAIIPRESLLTEDNTLRDNMRAKAHLKTKKKE